ncbi:uncharacterized protein LOC127286518 [Leptopilina boulardi]|uniref:uncharacterized protein LOC127286518 n=1 Tax=Leptopilina boulardi TaxID=63433 RepID=UPI0021F5C71A|nr:uncharacterized protein LOC127286518 [Leptopilina boulardi]
MSLIKKSLLLFLFIYILHVNHALRLRGAADIYRQVFGFKLHEIETLDQDFRDEYNELAKEDIEVFGKEFKQCRYNTMSNGHLDEYFAVFTNSSIKAMEKICNTKSYAKILLIFSSNCYSRIRKYILEYANQLNYEKTNECLKSINSMIFNKKTTLHKENSESESYKRNKLDIMEDVLKY